MAPRIWGLSILDEFTGIIFDKTLVDSIFGRQAVLVYEKFSPSKLESYLSHMLKLKGHSRLTRYLDSQAISEATYTKYNITPVTI